MNESFFSEVNGREVFDNGIVRQWRYPECECWQDWQYERCRGCGTPRDTTGTPTETPGDPSE